MNHTPEPWRVHSHHHPISNTWTHSLITDEEYGDVLGSVNTAPMDPRAEANARRIVACVNACRGLSTEDLEKTGLVSAVGYQLQRLTAQRDGLRAALEALVLFTKPAKTNAAALNAAHSALELTS